MQNAKIIKFIIPAMLLIGAGWWFYQSKQAPERKTQELLNKNLLYNRAEQVWDLWKNGKDSKIYANLDLNCKTQIQGKNRCSVELLKCLKTQKSEDLDLKTNPFVVFHTIEEFQKNISGFNEGARVVIGIEEVKITILLESSCHKIFLPKRNYAFGFRKNPDWTKQFDNFERNIFIDKEMTEVKGRTIVQLQEHCARRKMQLLESHILDAASIHPVDLRNNRPKYFLQPPLPWTRNFKSEYVYSAQSDQNFLFESKYCNFIYSKECKGEENTSLPSWMGLRNPLGSLMEVVRNPIQPDQKLIPSSTYYSVESKWHHLGKRANWTGTSYHRDEFSFAPLKSPVDENFDQLDLGFRCMQEEFLK